MLFELPVTAKRAAMVSCQAVALSFAVGLMVTLMLLLRLRMRRNDLGSRACGRVCQSDKDIQSELSGDPLIIHKKACTSTLASTQRTALHHPAFKYAAQFPNDSG